MGDASSASRYFDEYTREGLAIHCARSITAADVVHVLQRSVCHTVALPGYIKSDNGPEFIAQRVTTWLRHAACRYPLY